MESTMYRSISLFVMLLVCVTGTSFARPGCGPDGLWLQVLGSGGPEIDGRASAAYLVWKQGRARIFVDMGAGALLRFEQSGAKLEDLDVILLSHMHADHSNDLPALIKASFFSARNRDLLLYGPTGNQLMPSLVEFVQGLFGAQGVYRYLGDYLDGSESYRLLPHNVEASGKAEYVARIDLPYRLSAVPVHHGPIPALAWRVDIAGRSIVFSGDMNNRNNTLSGLAKQADLLVAHHAIAEQASDVALNLHMPPTVIGNIAAQAEVKRLLLSHRMQRTLGHEQQSLEYIQQAYHGPVEFAEDLQCYKL